ncbi:MAG: DNA mismatch repair endonuclease MutL [Dehalococcoidia bacterium]|nr:DNA mismatch repair endonuclease MutL [Dehalococcoidia bacterium]
MPIQQLPPQVAAQIAAGEVIERPASVVKELVENSLDAGATRIDVAIREGGVAEIRVTDDGCGIPADELALAFRHHATSKLATVADLQSVSTLGFRGEALPSIAAVARVTCTTRTPDADAGARIEFRYGEAVDERNIGCPVGATVQVVELFGNVPARRRFLRSPAAETARIQEVVTRYALANPAVRFSLNVDGRETVNTSGSGRLQDTILSIYGAEVAGRMLPVSHSEGEASVSGYASASDLSRHNRSYITLLVNHRWVYDRSIAYAIEQAYQGTLPDRRYPIAVIDIAIPPEQVDVNSHPSKREVRFRSENRLFSAVQRAVRDALVAHAPVRQVTRSFTPSGNAPAGDTAPPATPAFRVPAPYAGGTTTAPDPLTLPTTSLAPTGGSLRDVLAGLRVVGQIRQTYLVAEGPAGMYLIDQHAAHERVVYDQLRNRSEHRERASQPLLAPLPAELSASQAATVEEYAGLLAEYGFQLEPFGGNAWLVRAVPATLAARGSSDPATALTDLLDAVAVEQVVMEREDALVATIACHGSVRAGMTLAQDEMDALLRQLETTENPHNCPHGRPTVVHFTEYQLEREFNRR